MHLTVTNRDLPTLANLLDTLELTPAPSRARTRLLTQIRQAVETFSRDELELVTTYATTDSDGQPVVEVDGTITLADPGKTEEFHAEHTRLLSEQVTLELEDDKAHNLQAALEASTQTFTGDAATALDVLATALEQREGGSR